MDEVIELLFGVFGEGILTWVVRIAGVLCLVGAVVAFAVYELPLIAVGLAVAGIVLLVIPSLIMGLAGFLLEIE